MTCDKQEMQPVYWEDAKGVHMKLVLPSDLTSICIDCGVDTGPSYKTVKSDKGANVHRCPQCEVKTTRGRRQLPRNTMLGSKACGCFICKTVKQR